MRVQYITPVEDIPCFPPSLYSSRGIQGSVGPVKEVEGRKQVSLDKASWRIHLGLNALPRRELGQLRRGLEKCRMSTPWGKKRARVMSNYEGYEHSSG